MSVGGLISRLRWLALGADHMVILILITALLIKLLFFEIKDLTEIRDQETQVEPEKSEKGENTEKEEPKIVQEVPNNKRMPMFSLSEDGECSSFFSLSNLSLVKVIHCVKQTFVKIHTVMKHIVKIIVNLIW